ncbi:MAG: hypothetical protein K9K62_00450 [Desulfobacteraceae bacterium]|nr:hypothetical protein [Desulfobacteraceae bacterium]
MKPWWERFPERLEHEIERLESEGYSCRKDEDAFEAGYGALHLSTHVEGVGPLSLAVHFSYLHPYFPFQVICKDLDLPHHQNPFAKNLCILGRNPERWNHTWTVADVLTNMLPKVLEAGQADNQAFTAHLEQDQAEPFSEYYSFYRPSAVVWDGSWVLPETVSQGYLEMGFHPCASRSHGIEAVAKTAVLSILDPDGRVIAEANPRLVQFFGSGRRKRYPWVRVEQEIREANPVQFVNRLAEHNAFLKKQIGAMLKKRGSMLLGVVFPEEVKRRKTSDGWVFVYVKVKKSSKKR